MIDIFKHEQKKWKINQKAFILLLIGVLVYVVVATISFLVTSYINRYDHFYNYATDGAFSEEEFNALVYNTSIVAYLLMLATALIFMLFLCFAYKKNGVGYLFTIG